MKIKSLFRLTSHNQLVEVDDTSTSPNKVSKHVLIFENDLPAAEIVKKFFEKSSVGAVLVVDNLNKHTFNPFDTIECGEANLMVLSKINVDEFYAILCLPDNFLTLNVDQELKYAPKIFNIRVITLSDRAYRGVYADKSGPLIVELVTQYFKNKQKPAQIQNIIIPDNAAELSLIIEEAKYEKTDVLITTGGTGISRRDITVETIKSHIDKEIPGIMELIRMKYGAENPNALLSRGIAGTMGNTLIYTLPGSSKAVEEYLVEIFKTLDHLLYMIHGIDIH